MPKKYRLSRTDFVRLARARGRRIHGTLFSLTIFTHADGRSVKSACVVPKKIAPRAVDRNSIERRCREALRPLMPKLEWQGALVFHAKREAVTASYTEIERDIHVLLARVGDTSRSF